jgi:serine/threonine protein kinase
VEFSYRALLVFMSQTHPRLALVVSHVEKVARYNSECNGVSYWVTADMRRAVTALINSASFHGQIKSTVNDCILIQEKTLGGRFMLLPYAIRSLPRYTEKECRDLFRQMIIRVNYFHQVGLAHRFLHPESFIVESTVRSKVVEASSHYQYVLVLCIADCTAQSRCALCRQHDGYSVTVRGLQNAEICQRGRRAKGYAVNRYEWFFYIAPEIDKSYVHDARVDLWSLGSLLYTMVCGIGPFNGSREEICDFKSRGQIHFEIVSPSIKAQRLIRGLMQVDPAERLSFQEVLCHDWMTADDDELRHHDCSVAQGVFDDWMRTEH